MYSSFLRPYNPAKVQKDVTENNFWDDDFDNISLFVSSRASSDSSTSPGHKKSDSSSSLHFCENPTTNGTGTGAFQDMDDQQVSIIPVVPVFVFFLFQIQNYTDYNLNNCLNNLINFLLHWKSLALISQYDAGI